MLLVVGVYRATVRGVFGQGQAGLSLVVVWVEEGRKRCTSLRDAVRSRGTSIVMPRNKTG